MTVQVGIFWAIGGKVYHYIEERETDKLNAREKLSRKIDSDFKHFTAWDKGLAKKFPNADFAAYPRGRVMFDIKQNRHIIYADKCVTGEEIATVKALFQTINATVCRDEHYACDKCIKK